MLVPISIWSYQSRFDSKLHSFQTKKYFAHRWHSIPVPRHCSDWSGPVSVCPSPGSGPGVISELMTPVMPAQPADQSPEHGTSWSLVPASGPSHVEQHLDTWHVCPDNVLLWRNSALLIKRATLVRNIGSFIDKQSMILILEPNFGLELLLKSTRPWQVTMTFNLNKAMCKLFMKNKQCPFLFFYLLFINIWDGWIGTSKVYPLFKISFTCLSSFFFTLCIIAICSLFGCRTLLFLVLQRRGLVNLI